MITNKGKPVNLYVVPLLTGILTIYTVEDGSEPYESVTYSNIVDYSFIVSLYVSNLLNVTTK